MLMDDNDIVDNRIGLLIVKLKEEDDELKRTS